MQKIYLLFLLPIVLIINTKCMYAQPGWLDTSFGGGDGKVTLDINNDNDEAKDIAIQPNGKIVVLGTSYINFTTHFTLARFNVDGSIDNTFSDDGYVNIQFDGNTYNSARSVKLQSDGKILVAGSSYNGSYYQLAIARLHPDGSFDDTFGNAGQFVFEVPTNFYCYDMTLDGDERIIVVGMSGLIGMGNQMTVMRVLSNGTVDTSFGSAGANIAVIGGSSSADAVIVQTDGKIVLAGRTYGEFYSDIAVARFLDNGELDTSFDSDGKRTFSIAEYDDYITSMLQLPNGKLLLGGVSNTDFALVQLNTNGSNNNSFSGDGIVAVDMNESFDEVHDIALDSDGNIIAAGFIGYNLYDMAALRFSPNGVLDPLFHLDGKTNIDFSGTYDYCFAMAIQQDGKILIAGSTVNDGNTDLAIARIQSVCPVLSSSQNVSIEEGESFTVGTSTYTTSGVYQDVLTAYSGCDSTVTTTLTITVGIDDLGSNENQLNVWPIPFNQEIKVEGTAFGDIIQFTDLSGRILLQVPAQSERTAIPTQYLPAGMYILSLSNAHTIKTARILKVE